MASDVRNGMSAHLLGDVVWQKSTRSGAIGNCVEMAALETGGVAVRNSRHPAGPALVYTREEMAAFLLAIKEGHFDYMVA